ncbi:MAG TPA: hypothetical protein VFM67_08210 [Gaiella sp.]|jgi:NADPH:quinone reductase-like Zn-dependent oxidoreductase|nr:hypothetical protein [Gaiella sp.]
MSDAPATIRRTTMKAIVHERYGRPDVLALREVPVPAPVDDQVLVRVRASSVNPVEWYGVTGPVFAVRTASSTTPGRTSRDCPTGTT